MADQVVMTLTPPNTAALQFDALYRSSAADVYAYVAGMLRDRNVAEDVTALAFERAYRSRARFNPRRGSARSWLFAIARNAALDELRRRSRGAALLTEVADPAALEAFAAPGEDELAAERRATVRAAVASLDPRDRELISLKFHAGLSNEEIAKVVGLSASNAGTRLHRAVEKLRKACS